jgi:molybdopterin-guanine dinucleotide biosynthesis protein A
MGRDKAQLTLNGEPFWRRQARILQRAGAGTVGIVRQPTQAPLDLPPGIALWHDSVADAGPLAGLHAALLHCTTEWLAVVATDMPAIDASWFQWLRGHCRPGCGAMVRHVNGDHEPLAAIYPRAALLEVTRRLAAGPRSLQSLADALIAAGQLTSLTLPPGDAWRTANWNTPAEANRTLAPADNFESAAPAG